MKTRSSGTVAMRPWFPVAAIALSIALLALGCEGALRGYHLVKRWREQRDLPPMAERCLVPSDDREMIFELNPGWKGEGFSVNSHGMADDEIAPVPDRGVFRIAVVGDSISCGFRLLSRERIYLNVLEESLHRRQSPGTRFEVLNFGVNGYGILQDLQVVRKRVPPFQPSLIVVQLCLNDPYPSEIAYGGISAPEPRFRTWAFLSRVLRPDRFWGEMFVDRNYDARGVDNLRRGIAGIGGASQEGARVLAVLFPYLHGPAYRSWRYGRYHGLFRDEARASGLTLVDLHEEFERAGLIDDRWPKDPIHPDERGHRVAAEAILRELARLEWLP
jgi:lysophospholipase L1-like esterase